MFSGEEADSEDSGEDFPTSLAEVTEVVKNLLNGKVLGVDDNRECSRSCWGVLAGEPFQCSWRSGTLPRDLQTEVVVPIFKKGDQRGCSNYGGITLFSLPGKACFSVVRSTGQFCVHEWAEWSNKINFIFQNENPVWSCEHGVSFCSSMSAVTH